MAAIMDIMRSGDRIMGATVCEGGDVMEVPQ